MTAAVPHTFSTRHVVHSRYITDKMSFVIPDLTNASVAEKCDGSIGSTTLVIYVVLVMQLLLLASNQLLDS